ncbi:hypothetical protein C8F01DRAFT_1100802 [Mycena amicta]|nr:hypothetical protein C8F01DRAFT_1100802 [Mycena amicta]
MLPTTHPDLWDEAPHRLHSPEEQWWIDRQPFLLSCGYQLRARFRPDWIPSWALPGSGFSRSKENLCDFEDSHIERNPNVLDAVRTSDGTKVVLRRVRTWKEELSILSLLNSHLEPNNRTVRILDVIPLADDEEITLIVMPFLREFRDPAFRHLREIVEAMRQFLQGLEFMHSHNITHRDACDRNLVMDASKLMPGGHHFSVPWTENGDSRVPSRWRDRCSVAPIDYYFIDFGLSSRHEEGIDAARVVGDRGRDDTVPELSETVPYNPFKLDIYQLGNVFKNLIPKYPAIDTYFGPLLDAMTNVAPEDRPTASIALLQFEDACSLIPISELENKIEFRPQSPGYSGESNSDYLLDTASESSSSVGEVDDEDRAEFGVDPETAEPEAE